MSTLTQLRILDNIPSKSYKTKQAVDYFVGKGENGFEFLFKVINKLHEIGEIDDLLANKFINLLKCSKINFSGNYLLNLKEDFLIADHAYYFAITDFNEFLYFSRNTSCSLL